MTTAQIAALVAGAVALAVILDLVRRRQLREKYAALWLSLGAGMGTLAIFPGLLDWVAERLGVADPPNLLFFLGILVLLVVVVEFSFELSRLEDRLRTLAERLAILQADVEGSDPAPTVTEPDEPR